MAKKPLLLKDYLEIDSDSSDVGFIAYPRRASSVRFLLEAEQRCSGARLLRSRSKNALSKLSAVINAVKSFPISSPTSPVNLKRLGKMLGWIGNNKRKKKNKKKLEGYKVVTVKDIVRLDSFELHEERRSVYFASPVVSTCTSCSEGEEGSESFLSTSSGSSECFPDGRGDLLVEKSPESTRRLSTEKQEADRQGLACGQCQSEEEKEQLSPVSIMDFPDEEDIDEEEDEDAASSCFEESLANIERTTQQLLQKIRRFENIAELDPLDLEIRFSSFEDDEEPFEDDVDSRVTSPDEITARDLIQRLRTHRHVGSHSEKLILDFFIEALSWSAADASSLDIKRLLTTAGGWIEGGGCLKAEEHGRAQLRETEQNGRWTSFEGGKDDVAADVEGRVLGSLLQELVLELAMMG